MAKVNEKSTKGEIWDEYQRLLADLQQHPVVVSDDPVKLQKMTDTLTETKAGLVGRFDTTIERLALLQQMYTDADQDLGRRKALVIDAIEQDKKQLEATISATRASWEQERTEYELQRRREEDEFSYNLNRKRRDEREAYDEAAREREKLLATREANIVERERLAAELNTQVDAFPARLEAAAKAAQDEVAKDLKAERDMAVKDLKQAADHEKSILVLKLQTAEATIAAQAKQITELQRQLDASATQLKDMAITVIQAKNAPAASAPVA